MVILKEEDIAYSPVSIVDDVGKVFFYNDRVLRAISSEGTADLYNGMLKEKWISEIFDSGLVKTQICENLELTGISLILEHEKISFETHPAEWTSYMHWLAAKTIVNVCLKLSEHDFALKDGHPWNLMYHKGRPYYIDFGSITRTTEVSYGWLHEFIRYFVVPVWLSSTKWKRFALEYRRQHLVGFGLEFFELSLLKKFLFRPLDKIFIKYTKTPYIFFSKLDKWLDKHKPINTDKESWADYIQSHEAEDPLLPKTIKQKFVYDVLSQERPKKVLDCAANKGYYAEMAARISAAVIAFDYEEFCVDTCLKLAQAKNLDITPVVMDFKLPTPNYGIGLCGGSAFERFQSDIVLALGLAHHLCITQSLPVKVFCDICLKYAKKGVILEYVDPSDKHVMSWNKPIPRDYSLEGFIKYFSYKFPKMKQTERITDDGICRTIIYFHN